MRYADRYKPKTMLGQAKGEDPGRKRADEMAGLMNTGAGLAPGIGTVLGGIGGGAIGMLGGPGGVAAGAGLGMGIGGALGGLAGAGLQHGANEQTRPYDEAEIKKQARLEAVQRLLGRYL